MGGINEERYPIKENWVSKRLCKSDYNEYLTEITLLAFSDLVRDAALIADRDAEYIIQKCFLKAMSYWMFLGEDERQKRIEPFLLDLEDQLFS